MKELDTNVITDQEQSSLVPIFDILTVCTFQFWHNNYLLTSETAKQSCRDLLDRSNFNPSTSEPRKIPSEPRQIAELEEHQTREINTSERDWQSPHFTSPDYDLPELPTVTYSSIACSDSLDFLCNFSLSPTAVPGIECSDISGSSQLLRSTNSSMFDDLHFEAWSACNQLAFYSRRIWGYSTMFRCAIHPHISQLNHI